MKDLQEDLNVNLEETIFLGDDINDLTVFQMYLYSWSHRRHLWLQKKGLLHKKFKGGKGFIREIVYNLIISEKLDPYLSFETKND